MNDEQALRVLKRAIGAERAPKGDAVIRAQLVSVLALIGCILVVSLAPIITTGIMGRTIPDSLIAVSDKTITGLVGVLGTLVGIRIGRGSASEGQATGKPDDPVNMKEAGR